MKTFRQGSCITYRNVHIVGRKDVCRILLFEKYVCLRRVGPPIPVSETSTSRTRI